MANVFNCPVINVRRMGLVAVWTSLDVARPQHTEHESVGVLLAMIAQSTNVGIYR